MKHGRTNKGKRSVTCAGCDRRGYANLIGAMSWPWEYLVSNWRRALVPGEMPDQLPTGAGDVVELETGAILCWDCVPKFKPREA